MNSESCTEIADLLLPYSDGELSADDSGRVEDHLAVCPDCQRELSLLGRSLELARAIWQESAAAVSPSHPVTQSPPHPVIAPPATRHASRNAKRQARRRSALVACVAAGALIAVGAWLAFRPDWVPWPRWRGHASAPETHAHASVSMAPEKSATRHPPPATPHPAAAPEEIDVEEYIAREGRKARLQASIAILATEPSLKEYKERAERYLAEAYPETAPGAQPARAVNEHQNEGPKT